MKKSSIIYVVCLILIIGIAQLIFAEDAQGGPTSSHCSEIATEDLCNSYGANICLWNEQAGSCGAKINYNNSTQCTLDSDCKVNICGQNSCVNLNYSTPPGVGCAFPPEMRADYCKCENNTCNGYKASGGPICGNGHCEGEWEKENCSKDCNISDADNKILPGEGKTKILPETAALRARERLGELGFNITLKEVGQDKKLVYEVTGEKEGKILGLFKVKGKVSADVDAENGDVIKVHKPWWAFIASGI